MQLKKAGILVFIALIFIKSNANQYQAFDKTAFYAAMQSNNLDEINTQLNRVAGSSLMSKDAFTGALLMKKASLAQGAGNKLNLFKSGRKLLESAIKKENDNAEFRFLRLMVQEHAPSILNYKSDLGMDSGLIKKKFNGLPLLLKQSIKNYCKESKILKPEDF